MGGRNPTCEMFALVCMATKAAVPPTAAVSNETADAANAGMPKAHQPKQTHKQACEEPAHHRAHKAQAQVPFRALGCQRREFDATLRYRDAVFFLLELLGSMLIPRFVTRGLHPGL